MYYYYYYYSTIAIFKYYTVLYKTIQILQMSMLIAD
jgi:hypothetical protein